MAEEVRKQRKHDGSNAFVLFVAGILTAILLIGRRGPGQRIPVQFVELQFVEPQFVFAIPARPGRWEMNQNETWSKTWSKSCKPYPGKRVVLVQCNAQYLDMFRNWLFHASRFLNPQTDQLVVAAASKNSVPVLEGLSGLYGVHWDVQFIGSSGENTKEAPKFGSGIWSKVVVLKPKQIMMLLDQNCSVLYSDVDIAWVRPIFDELDSAGRYDGYIADDAPPKPTGGLNLCTCTIYVHPTNANKGLIQTWATGGSDKDLRDQPRFNHAFQAMNASGVLNWLKLSQDTFPPGWKVQTKGYRLGKAAVIHANFVIGTGKKIDMLKKLGLWSPSGVRPR